MEQIVAIVCLSVFALVFMALYLYEMQRRREISNSVRHLDKKVEVCEERVYEANERQCILQNKYFFLLKEFHENPSRMIDLFGSITGSSSNEDASFEWAVQTMMCCEEFRDLCHDIKTSAPKQVEGGSGATGA